MSYLLGVDSGTSACKIILFSLDGKPLHTSIKEHKIYYPGPTWAEQNPDEWWFATIEGLKEITKHVNPQDICGVGVDSQREAVILLDKNGKSIMNSIIWLDRRTLPQVESIKQKLAQEDVIFKTGLHIDYFYSASKLMWIKEEKPDLFSKVQKILFPKDYIIYKLTGEATTDYSMASRTMLFNINKLAWDEEICETLEVPLHILPLIKGSWEVVGEVTFESAKITGLKPGTPIVAGGGDRPCEALGAGVIKQGKVNIGTGTGTMITTPLNKPKPDTIGRIDCCCHVVPNMWEYELVIIATGASLKWFKENFVSSDNRGNSTKNIYDHLLELASNAPLGSEGLFYYPYPMGAKAPKFNDLAKAVFFGFTLSHSKAHFIRAIIEGVAFQYAETLELLAELGIKPTEASIVGGEAKSDLWNQIKADVTGLKLFVPDVMNAAALGAAILAGVGGGIYRSGEDGVNQAVRFRKVYLPNEKNHYAYRAILEKYKKIYEFLAEGYKVI
jgi:xylulokinase